MSPANDPKNKANSLSSSSTYQRQPGSVASIGESNNPLPTLEEEGSDHESREDNGPRVAGGQDDNVEPPLPPIRPRSSAPSPSRMTAMKPRSISPPPPPPSTIPSSRGQTSHAQGIVQGEISRSSKERGGSETDCVDDVIDLHPDKPQSDSVIESSIRSTSYPTSNTASSDTAAQTSLENQRAASFRSSSDGSTRGRHIRQIFSSGSGNHPSPTASNNSNTSGSGGFKSNISRKSEFIRSTLARRSTATLSRLGSRGSEAGLGGSSTSKSSKFTSSGVRMGSTTNISTGSNSSHRRQQDNNTPPPTRVYRGYTVGDMVLLVSDGRHSIHEHHHHDDNDNYNHHSIMNNSSTLVNRYGYPPGEGSTIEEQHGPYLYILGTVKQIHYEENAVFYTVTREDNGKDVRGDAGYMEPIQTQAGLEAARRAANGTNRGLEFQAGLGENGNIPEEKRCFMQCVENICLVLLLPFIWIYDIFVMTIGARLFRCMSVVYEVARNQGSLFLNGLPPYTCAIRITTVNLIVLCSIWYMFIDQMRIAFFPAESDYILAIINFIIWTILALELIFEVFIRPDGYFQLIRSDKAFIPTTVRYLSWLHLIVETISLIFFAPEFWCLFDANLSCSARPRFSFLRSTLMAIAGADRAEALAGRAFYACIRLRVFGLVRLWRNMWVNKTFIKNKSRSSRFTKEKKRIISEKNARRSSIDIKDAESVSVAVQSVRSSRFNRKQRDAAVIKASNIGTALMVTNSYRSLTMLCLVMGLFPMITLIYFQGVVNPVAEEMIALLQGTNLEVIAENSTGCQYFADSVEAWVESFLPRDISATTSRSDTFLLSMQIIPPRCSGYLQQIDVGDLVFYESACLQTLNSSGTETESCIVGKLRELVGRETRQEYAEQLDLRVGNIVTETSPAVFQMYTTWEGNTENSLFSVSATYNYTYSTEASAMLSFLLQLCLLISILAGLIVLRYDAEHLVLRPLRSMLKIVARYAKNPLAQATPTGRDTVSVVSESESEFTFDDDDDASEGDGFGTYETEQLITAVSKITDLLRKCWGVAGADIISTNLASREGELAEVFNPTVPGKSVYALFAFAAINGFDHALKCLGGDVMILINDVALVLHGEVFRWGFGDSGQCNKNLGNAFLMVFRIGLVREVVEKLEEATRVVFSTSEVKKVSVKKRSRDKVSGHLRKASANSSNPYDKYRVAPNFVKGLKSNMQTNKHNSLEDAMQLSLQSLPGISTFTDRAVIGMLKSFAGIHRDNNLRAWSRDFRLSAGVGAWSVNMIFGMDAGWAVEGAVGSEYKIDATYLSPHVNMASRMMSACKHYGVTILLSEAVQELMSDQAKSRLRNLDRVTVKGSTQVQNIYTYDARSKGADFFLYSRSDEQADLEADRYQPNIWFDDQDLKAMRHHVTEDFEQEFMAGLKYYYDGDWPAAIEKLEGANEIMVDAAMEEGYLHDEMDDSPDRKELYRTETADGPCKYLINFMKSQGGKAPPNWDGWHPLLSK